MNILTFDIEDWFHILDNRSTKTESEWQSYESRLDRNINIIFELLASRRQKATFFCLGWIAKKYPHIIKTIDSLGHEVASHSHLHQLAYEQTKAQFTTDLEQSIKSLEDLTGKKVRAYRAPGFSLTDRNTWAFDVLAGHGIEIDCSIFPARRNHGGFRSFGAAKPLLVKAGGVLLKEFPINLGHLGGMNFIFSGGGYFRLLPYPVIKRYVGRSNYVMTYFHPRDFDPRQPRIRELSVGRTFKSYYGLSSTRPKLDSLLRDFKFTDLDSADKSIDWTTAEVVSLDGRVGDG